MINLQVDTAILLLAFPFVSAIASKVNVKNGRKYDFSVIIFGAFVIEILTVLPIVIGLDLLGAW